MNYKIIIAIVAGLLFLVLASLLGHGIIDDSISYRNYQEQYTHELNYEKRLLRADEYIKGDSAWEEKKAAADHFRSLSVEKGSKAEAGAIFLAAIVFSYIVTMLLVSKGWRKGNQKMFIISLLLASLPLLCVGLFAPMLEISAFELNLEIPIEIDTKIFGSLQITKTFPGEMFFYYQSKSVIELITLLSQSGNKVVALSIVAFSVIIPVTKLVACFVLLLSSKLSNRSVLRFLAFGISKWSMADVFVIATFLAYLSFNSMSTGIQTQSRSLPGLYFFIGYCLVSLLATSLSNLYVDRPKSAVADT